MRCLRLVTTHGVDHVLSGSGDFVVFSRVRHNRLLVEAVSGNNLIKWSGAVMIKNIVGWSMEYVM